VQQYLAAGPVDEFDLHIVPILLGAGERLLENVGNLKLEPHSSALCEGAAATGGPCGDAFRQLLRRCQMK
jgi:dihydrofolate reductase